MMLKRRIAVHELHHEGKAITPAFIELLDDFVVSYGHLDRELPMTEWVGGVVFVKEDQNGVLRMFRNE